MLRCEECETTAEGEAREWRAYLGSDEDDEIAEYFISTAFPPTVNMHEILAALDGRPSMAIAGLQRDVNLSRGRIVYRYK